MMYETENSEKTVWIPRFASEFQNLDFLRVSAVNVVLRFLNAPPRRIKLMPLRTFAFVPGRPAVFAECFGRGRIGSASELQGFALPVFLAQRSQHSLGREWRFAQANSHGVVNGVGDRRN